MIEPWIVEAGLCALTAGALWVASADVGDHELGSRDDDDGAD